MTKVPSVRVSWFDGRTVGRVVQPGPIYFGYDEEWLRQGLNLSPLVVPFTADAYRQPSEHFDHLPGFLSDCLPDAWGRRLLDRDLSAQGIRVAPLSMLSWVGSRAVGALRFEPEVGVENSHDWLKSSTALLAREARAVVRADPPAAFEHLRRGGSAGGALPKVTIAQLADGTLLVGGDVSNVVADHPGAVLGILKLDEPTAAADRETDGRFEHAHMRMAAAAGIATAATRVMVEHRKGAVRHHLFVERFDCLPRSRKRYHVLTLAGALESYSLDYRKLLDATRRLTESHREVVEAVRRMVFNVRAANADDHGKNHAFLLDPDTGAWRLSPAYDLTLNADSLAQYHGLSVSTFGTSPDLHVMRGLAADYGVTADEFADIDGAVTRAIARWPEFAADAGVPATAARKAAEIHTAIAAVLKATVRGKPTQSKRRRLWE